MQNNKTVDQILELVLRWGLASIFLINFVNGLIEPEAFVRLLETNVFVPGFVPADPLVKVATFNDLLLGLFVLSGWKKKWIYAWSGAWLLVVALTKIGYFLA